MLFGYTNTTGVIIITSNDMATAEPWSQPNWIIMTQLGRIELYVLLPSSRC